MAQASDAVSTVKQTPTPPPGDAGVPDAAAKHAKRTACIKEAKTRKLLGPDRNAYIQKCVEAP